MSTHWYRRTLVAVAAAGILGTSACGTAECEDSTCHEASSASVEGLEAQPRALEGCVPSGTVESACADVADDDCDGLVDCADPDCLSVCTCPQNGPLPDYVEHGGLRSIDASNFQLQDTGTWTSYASILDGLKLPKVSLETMSMNRTATQMPLKNWVGFKSGFFWDQGDLDVKYWIPQGLAGGTAGTRKLIAVSWHYETSSTAVDPTPPIGTSDKGVRLSIADVDDMNAVTYRHVLLVEPDATRGFKPIAIHAGGLAWSGSYLYVADTSRGVRVFDLNRILQVSTSSCNAYCGKVSTRYCAFGYSYVVPQVGGYYFPTNLNATCRPAFSYLTLDRSSSPISLISGEYNNDTVNGIYSRLLRWPLVETTDRLETTSGTVRASEAWYAGSRNLQGVSALGSKFFLNATRYYGALMTSTVGSPSTVYRADADAWGWMPEGMYISTTGNLWVNTEGHTNLPRSVFMSDVAAIP